MINERNINNLKSLFIIKNVDHYLLFMVSRKNLIFYLLKLTTVSKCESTTLSKKNRDLIKINFKRV